MRGGRLRRGMAEAPREAGLTPPRRLRRLPSHRELRQPICRPELGAGAAKGRSLLRRSLARGVSLVLIWVIYIPYGCFLFLPNDVLETGRKTFPLAWTVDHSTWALVLQVKYRDWVLLVGEIFSCFVYSCFCQKYLFNIVFLFSHVLLTVCTQGDI